MNYKEYLINEKRLQPQKKEKIKKILSSIGISSPLINQIVSILPTIINVLMEDDNEI